MERQHAFTTRLLSSAADVLGLWIAANEGAKFWLSIMNNLRNRGVTDDEFAELTVGHDTPKFPVRGKTEIRWSLMPIMTERSEAFNDGKYEYH